MKLSVTEQEGRGYDVSTVIVEEMESGIIRTIAVFEVTEYAEIFVAQAAEIERLHSTLEWIAKVQHFANFHETTDWLKCNSVTCKKIRTELEKTS